MFVVFSDWKRCRVAFCLGLFFVVMGCDGVDEPNNERGRCVERFGECGIDGDCSENEYCSCEQRCERIDRQCGDGEVGSPCWHFGTANQCKRANGITCFASDVDDEPCDGTCNAWGDECDADADCSSSLTCESGYCALGTW